MEMNIWRQIKFHVDLDITMTGKPTLMELENRELEFKFAFHVCNSVALI